MDGFSGLVVEATGFYFLVVLDLDRTLTLSFGFGGLCGLDFFFSMGWHTGMTCFLKTKVTEYWLLPRLRKR